MTHVVESVALAMLNAGRQKSGLPTVASFDGFSDEDTAYWMQNAAVAVADPARKSAPAPEHAKPDDHDPRGRMMAEAWAAAASSPVQSDHASPSAAANDEQPPTTGEQHTEPKGDEAERNECDCLRRPDSEGMPAGSIPASPTNHQPDGISDDKDTIITLQKHRIESLEQAIGLARNDYYDKGDDYGFRVGDGDLWNHPLMANLMAVLARDGHTPMGKDTQICLVKAALRSMPERESNALSQNLESMQQTNATLVKRLTNAIGGLRSIAYGDAQTWPNCSSREVAKQALQDCGGEKSDDRRRG